MSYVYSYLRGPGKSTRFPGACVRSNCELLAVGAGNQTLPLVAYTPNWQTISPAPVDLIFILKLFRLIIQENSTVYNIFLFSNTIYALM